jgi:hypothetical protein
VCCSCHRRRTQWMLPIIAALTRTSIAWIMGPFVGVKRSSCVGNEYEMRESYENGRASSASSSPLGTARCTAKVENTSPTWLGTFSIGNQIIVCSRGAWCLTYASAKIFADFNLGAVTESEPLGKSKSKSNCALRRISDELYSGKR